MTRAEKDALLKTLEERFAANPSRHARIAWPAVLKRLEANPKSLEVLHAMEHTGGEPDVIGLDAKSGKVTFCDCAEESPKGRRSVCYDGDALRTRKENKPRASALGLCDEIGISLLDEAQYRHLQTLGEFDRKTSSWVRTPADIREEGGALFCDRRYGHVFTYHNGAESYYAARAFRGLVEI